MSKMLLFVSFMASISAQSAPQSWKELRAAVTVADEITLDAAVDLTADYDSAIVIPAGTSVAIHGSGAVLDASKNGYFFRVEGNAELTLNGLTFRNGYGSGDVPGAIITLPFGILVVSDSVFDSNSAYKIGGAILNVGDMQVHRCLFHNNTAASGGAIGSQASFYISGTNFTENCAGGDPYGDRGNAGAIFFYAGFEAGGTIDMHGGAHFTGNTGHTGDTVVTDNFTEVLFIACNGSKYVMGPSSISLPKLPTCP
jgi:predicted outer membrane repeat protein